MNNQSNQYSAPALSYPTSTATALSFPVVNPSAPPNDFEAQHIHHQIYNTTTTKDENILKPPLKQEMTCIDSIAFWDGSLLPIDLDPRGNLKSTFETSLCKAPFYNCQSCINCFTGLICPCAMISYTRYRSVNRNMQDYKCCQGYDYYCTCCHNCICVPCENNCPHVANCTESWCCPLLSLTRSRLYVQDKYQLRSDPTDRRLIRLRNFCYCFECILICTDCYCMMMHNNDVLKEKVL